MNRETFETMATWVASNLGSPKAFLISVLVVILWALCGPIFNYSDSWQLVINTGTTIGTFLMVFLLQNSQNRVAESQFQTIVELANTSKKLLDRIDSLEHRLKERLEEVQESVTEMNESVEEILEDINEEEEDDDK